MIYRSRINGVSGQAALAAVLEQNGPLLGRSEVHQDSLARYSGVLPPAILDFWEAYGIGDLAQGRLRLTLPEAFAGALSVLFKGDKDFETGGHVIAYGPFGDLLIWHERHWLIYCNMALAIVDAPFFFRPQQGTSPDQIILDQVLGLDPAVLDMDDDLGTPMFERARNRLGPLGRDQIYGLMPPVAVGLPIEISRLAITPAEEWLVERFLGWTYTLSDYSGHKIAVREIGAQG